ncbi:Uu.00g092630.m01.CDS01 [Anthostomella pinea]|uniref:Uu.00g092630.m01.CDS01 n=1 Tax=Anthostomella pinea TaxID=933095 RepID=A0AAI8VNZ4_9PEZI|nr:Uu.00g092630.m01.CDS01 [Anthostomella pinea]
MSDKHILMPTGPRGTLRARRDLRSSSQSPARQHRSSDDLLSRLTPASAVEALRSPTGALKTCIDQASVSEQSFAMRAALASKQIQDWLDELNDWPWPSSGGPVGFEMPSAKRRKLSEPETPQDSPKGKLPESAPYADTSYVGSLLEADVVRYERRVEQIYRDMEGLGLEEIKTQVLHNHILPLSRPGTPFSDGGRSVGSAFSFARMEDLTAVVTAITVQALPNLSRLSRLLNTWSVRLLVLRKVPPLLSMIADAEIALGSGWSALDLSDHNAANLEREEGTPADGPSFLSRNEFNVIRRVLQQKVTTPGRDLDSMLDALEGMMDTLPDEWLDRMERIERDYAEWVTTAERQVQEGEWAEVSKPTTSVEPPLQLDTTRPKIQIQEPSPTKQSLNAPESNRSASRSPTSDYSSVTSEHTDPRDPPSRRSSAEIIDDTLGQGAVRILVDEPDKSISGSTSQVVDLTQHAAHQHEVDTGAVAKDPSLDYDGVRESRQTKPDASDFKVTEDPPRFFATQESRGSIYDGSEDVEAFEDDRVSLILSEVHHNIVRAPRADSSRLEELLLKPASDDEFEPSVLESVNEEDEELDLPPARLVKERSSQASLTSTLLHEPSSNFPDHSDNMPYREDSVELELPRLPDPNEPFSSDALSPPSSPPLRYKPRSTSVTFKDHPEVAPLPEVGGTPPGSPLQPPDVFDPDTSFDWESQLHSPGRMSTVSTTSDDDHLHQQIRDVLQNIPVKISMTKSRVNLNPPDFQHPTRPKATKSSEPLRRSGSSLSSRAETPSYSRAGTPSYSRSGTPSFMLAPVRDARPRSKSSQGIRIYHLSSRSGEPPIKLFIRTVGEKQERVMVRVGGGWADLGEYLRDYASHHSRRSKGEGKVELIDSPSVANGRLGSSPASRPGSAMDSPMTPLGVRKTRKISGQEGPGRLPKMPWAPDTEDNDEPSSSTSARSRASSHVDWDEEDSSLGLAGPKAPKRAELDDETRAWVQSVKQKVRVASGERTAASEPKLDNKSSFSDMGKVGSTKRLFRKN